MKAKTHKSSFCWSKCLFWEAEQYLVVGYISYLVPSVSELPLSSAMQVTPTQRTSKTAESLNKAFS